VAAGPQPLNEPAWVAADARLSEAERCERLCEIFKNVELPDMRQRLLAPLAAALADRAPEGETVARTLFFVGTTWENQVARVAALPHLQRMLQRHGNGLQVKDSCAQALEAARRLDLPAYRQALRAALDSHRFPAELAPVFALEAQALRERTHRLADAADPYSMRAMARLLPRLRLYDELADRLDLLSREGAALAVPDLGLLKLLGEKEYDRFCQTFARLPGGAELGRLLAIQSVRQLDPPQVSALFTVSRVLGLPEAEATWWNHLSFWLDLFQPGTTATIPARPTPAQTKFLNRAGIASVPGGFEVSLAHLDLAVLLDAETASVALVDGRKPPPPDWKGLVLSNITRETLLVSLLNNPKVVRVPGLVEAVVINCRSSQVLSFIAQKRELHTGHQNKGVPAALLRGRVKVPMTLLRRFIHLRFVSRADLKEIAQRAPRPEVAKEAADYLASI